MPTQGRLEPAKTLIREQGFAHRLFESVAEGIVACDADGRIALFNLAARTWFGGDLAGISLDDWATHPARYTIDGLTPLPAENDPLVRAFKGEKLAGEAMAVIAPGKPTRFLRISGSPIRDEQERKLGAVVVMCDITKLHLAAGRATEMEEANRNLRAEVEKQQREREQAGRERALLRCILDSADDLIFIKDRNSVYQGCNKASEQFLGLSESEQIGKTDEDFFGSETYQYLRTVDQRVMETGRPVRSEEWVTYADGHKALMDTVKVPYRGPEGELLGLVGIARDITERVRAEEALKESEAKFIDLYENAPDMYASVNAETALIEECNMTLANTLGYAKEEIIGRSAFEIYHPDCLEEAKNALKVFKETGEVHGNELQLRRKDGSKLDVSLNASAVRGDNGQILHSRSTLHDITEQKWNKAINAARFQLVQFAGTHSLDELLEETLNEMEELTDSLIGFYHFVADDQTSLVLQNWSTRTKAQFCKTEGKGMHYPIAKAGVWVDCVHQGKAVIHNDYASLPHRKGMPAGHAEVVRELVFPVLRGGEIKAILGVGNKPSDYTEKDIETIALLTEFAWEIAERKRSEEKMLRSEQRLRLHSEQSPLGFLEWDKSFRAIEWNAACERIFGYTRKEAIGRHARDLILPVEVHNLGDSIFKSLMNQTGGRYCINENITKDGRIIICEWFNTTLIDKGGKAIGIASVCRDITEQKHMEAELINHRMHLEEQVTERTTELESANRELEAFTYSVSHDLRAPLRHIDGFLALLQKKSEADLDEKCQHYMEAISGAAQKMGMLIDNLLSFSRMGRHAMLHQQVDLGMLVREVIQELEPDAAGRNIHWHIGDLPVVTGDAAMLRMVLANLVDNALKFTRPRQEAEIEIGTHVSQSSEAVVFVRDNGVGFDMAYADKLFCVFQRLHRTEEFEGTGIGLANVRRIIARHGGRTWAEGKLGQGAAFYFALPRSLQGDSGQNI